MKPVLVDIEEGIAHVRLNRPDASNALDTELLRALHQALVESEGARVVLLTGEGKNFCAGGDVKTFASKGEQLPEYLREATRLLAECAAALIHLPAPVIAAVQGYAAGGGGVGLVCVCDLVVAADSAKFMLGATRVGMAPDAGASVTLARIIGLRRAMDLALTNRTLDAHEAFELGLVNRVVPDAELADHAETLARELAAGSARALAETKRLMWSALGVDEFLAEEARTVSELSGSADAREGLQAVIEKRQPRFVL